MPRKYVAATTGMPLDDHQQLREAVPVHVSNARDVAKSIPVDF
jgi:hypothetical protein